MVFKVLLELGPLQLARLSGRLLVASSSSSVGRLGYQIRAPGAHRANQQRGALESELQGVHPTFARSLARHSEDEVRIGKWLDRGSYSTNRYISLIKLLF